MTVILFVLHFFFENEESQIWQTNAILTIKRNVFLDESET